MSAGGPNSVAVSRQSARHVVALGLVLLSVTVAGAALGGVTAAESQSSPVEVSDWTDLDDIRNDTDADYVLVNDLNETTAGYETVAGPNANGGKGFAPIGGFNRSFDGQGNSIANLTIDRPSENEVGLFGDTSGTAVIEEVIITSATVTGSSGDASSSVGGLIGYNGGTVSNSSVSGAVNGFVDVGGLVGLNGGTVSNSEASGVVDGSSRVGGLVGRDLGGTVSNSEASATVTGSGDISFGVGGLVGLNGGTVSNSLASGAVDGTSEVGGLVGRAFGPVGNSSASGAVDGTSEVGGLVGWNPGGAVSESFATGAVTGSSNVGGLVGKLGYDSLNPGEEATLRDSYYDTQTTEQQAAVGTIKQGDGTAELRGEVAGLPTSQMQGASAAQNMGELDFTSTWRVVTDPPGYPELRSPSDGPDPEPPLTAGFSITPEDPTVGEQLTFDADPSTPESDIESYDWTLGDGTTATGKQVTHTYTDSGQFTVELTVQDGTETDTATKTVSVSPPSGTFGIESITPYVGGTAVEEYTHVEDLNTSLSYRVRVTQPSATANVTFELGGTTYTDTDGSDGWQFPVPTAQLASDETLLVTAYGTDGASAVDSISVPVVETPAWFDLLDPISRFEDRPIIELQAEFPSGGGSPIQLPNQFPFAGDVSLPVVGSSQSSDLTATVTVRVNLRTAEATVTVGGVADYSLSNRVDLSGGVSGSASLNLYEMDIRGGTLDAEVGAEITFPGIPNPPIPPVPPGAVNLYPIFGIEAAAEAQFDEVDSVNGTNPVGFELTEGSITPELYARQELGQKLPVAELVFGIEEGVNTTIPYPSFEPINGSAFAEVYLRAAAAGLEASVSFPPGEDRFSYQFGPLGGDTVPAPNLTESSPRATTPTVEWQPVDQTGSAPPDRQLSATGAATARDGPTPVVAPDAVAGNRITDNAVADKTPALAGLGSDESTLLWSQQQPNLSVLNGREILASTSTNGTSFGTPVALTNDTVSDYYPTITPTGGTTSEAVAAFTTFDKTFNESTVTNPGDIYPHGEIRIARLTETGWQSPTFLTNNTAFDFRPTVASRGDNWTIAWTRDEDGDLSTWSDRAVVYVRYNESGPVGTVRSVEQARSPRLTTVDGTTRLTYLDMASNATSGQLVIGSLQPGQSAPVEQASYSVSNLTDLTAANDTIVWTTTSGEPWAQVADTEGVRNLSAPTGLTPPQSVTLSSRPGRLLLNFRAARPDSGVAEAYYRPRVDGVWQSSRRYASGADANLTYWQATTAGTESGFTSVVAGKELDTAQKDDLFVFQSQFRPDLAVTVQNRSENVTVGDEATLTVTVNNSGDIATDATTVTATNSSGTVATASVPALQPGSSVERSLTATLDNSGQLRVTVDPNGTIQEHSEANNQETVRFQPPDLTVINRTVTRLNGTIRVNATLGNPSSITAPAVTYRIENGPTQNRSGSVGALAPGVTTQVSATFDASALSPRFPLTIRVDPTDSLTESNERNNTLVGPIREPEIAVSAEQITYGRQNGTIVATVPIENTGTGGGEGTLQITGAESETVIATQSFEVGPAVRTASSVVNSTQVALPGVTRNETVILNASARPQENGSSAVVDRVTTTDTVTPPPVASFNVTITNTTEPVEGQALAVTTQITNTGAANGTQSVTLDAGGLGANSTTVTLAGGATTTEVLTVTTGSGDAGNYTAQVASENDTASTGVRVDAPATFDVTLTSVDNEVTAGDTIGVTYEVTNTGDLQDTQALDFAVNGTSEDTEAGITLNGSETFSGQFTYTTGSVDTPAVNVTVASEDDSATETVTVDTQNASVSFDDQATASSTFTSDTPSEPGVVVGPVDSDVDSAVVVTYPETGLQSGDKVTIDLDNVGFQAWEINGVSGDADSIDDVVVDGGNNPTLRLVEGVEYTFEDLPFTNHPLAFFSGGSNDDILLSQDGDGSYEDDPDVGWEDTGNTVTFTATGALLNELDGYNCTIHSSMQGSVQSTSETTSGLVIAGLDTFNASTLDGSSVPITVEEFGGFPGNHTAHIIPTADLSGTYSPGDVVSDETASAIIDNETATVYQGTLDLNDQTVDGPVQEGETLATVSVANLTGGDAAFTVDVHPTDEDGTLLGPAYVGSSDVLTGQNTDVPITAEQAGQSVPQNEFPLTGVNDLVTMIHVVDDSASAGDPASPGEYPVLPHGSTDGFVPGGVTDPGTVTVDTLNASVSFDDQATASSTFTSETPSTPGVVVESVDSDVDSTVVVTYSDSTLQAGDQVTVDLDNVGFSAWEINGVSGDADSVEDIVVDDINNPTLRLVEGVEYTFEGLPGSNHPLEFFDANGDALLSQDGDGSYEDDPAVDWTDSGNSVSFTATSGLTADFDGYRCTIHSSSMVGDTTSTAATDLIIAGLETLAASDLDGGSVAVPVNDIGGFPGNHTAHIVPTADLSGTYSPGDVVSDETASAIIDNETATVFQGTLDFANQSYESPTTEVTAATANLTGGPDTLFVVNLHETTATGAPGAYVGASAVLSGSNQDVAIPLRDSDGNPIEFDTTNEYITMIHVVDNESASEGDLRPPGTFPILTHGSTDGFVPGGVTDPGTVTVNEPASFDVTITSVDSAVTAGEIVTASYEVTNRGDVQDTQDIEFTVNGKTEDTESGVTLNESGEFSGEFSYVTGSSDTPAVTVGVASEDDSASTTVTVLAAGTPSFDVTFTILNSTVTAGEKITAGYRVTNRGDVQDTQDIEFTVNGKTEDTESGVTLNESGEFSGEFSYVTGSSDTPAVTVGVASEDDSASTTVTVLAAGTPSFDVTFTILNSTVTAGEKITAGYRVTNRGDVQDTQDIEFTVNGKTEDTESGVTLNESGEFSGEFSYVTGSSDTPAVTVGVASEDDSASTTVTVLAAGTPSFDVTLTSVNSVVTAGELITASYEVTNTGDVQATQDISFTVNGSVEDTESGVTLSGSETVSGQFSYTTGSADTPVVSVAVASEDDSAIKTVTVTEPANFDVTITSVDAAVTEGETITVAYEVTNTGDVQATQDIGFAVNGTAEDTASGVTLNGSETVSDQFKYDTVAGNAPAVSVAVSSADDSASETVTVNEPANFDVTLTSVDSAVTEGETVTVAYEVTNTGDVADTQDIGFAVNGTTEDTASGVTLNGSETFSGQFTYTTVVGDAPAVSVAVSSADDSATETVTVNEPSSFDVTITSVDAAVTEGETITVAYEVTNTGDVQDTQDIDFAVNGTTEDTASSVTLSGSETFSGQFTYTTAGGDAPAVSVAVLSDDDSSSSTVTVNEPASLDVTLTSVDSAVTEGDDVTVEYQVENTGGQSGTQAIEFLVNGTVESTQTVTLDDGELRSNSFTYTTVTGDAPELTTEVRSENDTDTATVAVNESPPNFEVNITDTPVEVTEGDDVTVEYQVENTGGQSGTQAIEFLVDGTVEGTQTVTLDDGELRSDSFTYTTVKGDAPELTTEVRSENDTDTATVAVNESPPNFEVNITDTPVEVTEGDEVTVEYQVENTGGQSGTQAIEFLVDGTVEGTQTVTLNGEEISSNSFTYDTVAGDAPAVSVTVSSADDSASETVTVNEPANFDVTLTSVDSAVTKGEAVTVAYEVTNTGDVADTQDITFAVNGTPEDTETGVTLNGSETFSGQFVYETGASDISEITVAVASADDTGTETVTVNEEAIFAVAITSVDTTVTEGETITVAYEVTNTGDVEDTQDIGFAVNGTTEDTEANVTLAGGETFSGQFTYATVAGDASAVSVTVSSADDSATESVVVNEPSSFDVTLTSVDSAVTEGETITVAYEVTNTGDVQATQDIGFAVNGTAEDTASGVTLDGSETFSGQFSYDTVAGDTPAVSVTVSSADDSASATVTVNEPANFDVNVTSVDSEVTEGETITVAYEVTNTGDVAGTQSITFAVNETTESAESRVTLNGSETVSGQFSYDTVAGDTPAVTVTVSSLDDSATKTVTVNEPANFDVTITSVDAAVTEGETITVAYEVTNTGDVQATQDIGFAVNGTTEDTASGVTLNGSETVSDQFSYDTVAGDVPAVSVAVSSADDSASETVTVNEPANFDVTLTSVDSAVTEGETVTVAYKVTNTGDVVDTQDIGFAVNGTTEDTASSVTLNGSETFSGQFTYATASGDAPAVSVAVLSADDSATQTVTVNEPANFDVTLTSVDSAVTEGETITVAYEVTNTGDAQDTQDITFAVNGTTEDTESGVTLSGSETVSGQFTYDTVVGEAPAVTVAVSSADDSDSNTVTVNEPSSVVVEIVETNTPVEGEQLTVTATIENTGDVQDTQEINLSVGPLGSDSTTVTLGGGASTNVTLSVGTDAGDAGEYTATVSSADDAASATVSVLASAEFVVSIVETTSPVEGESLTVTATIENTGDVQDTQTVTLDVGPPGSNSTAVTLGGGTSTNVTLSVGTGAGDAGEYTATVASADDAASANVTVLAPAEFVVSIVGTTTPVEGEQLNVTAQVRNTGDVQDTQSTELSVGALGTDSTTVTLGGGASTNVTLSVGTGAGDAGAYTATVSSAADSASANVTVLALAEFTVNIVETTSPVEGESLSVTANIQNSGDVEDTQEINLSVGPLGTDSTTVTLGGGASTDVTLSVGTGAGDAGAYTVTVASEDDTASANVTINEPSSFDVTIPSVDAAVTEGETITVAYEVTNTGDVADTQDITFAVNGTTEDTASSVTLNGSETVSGQFTYATAGGDVPAVSVAVSSADDSATEMVTVNEPAEFDVTLTSVNSTVTAGETITASYEVTNTGDVADTQDIGFAVNGTTEDTASGVTLNGSETVSGQFTYATAGGDVPAVSVAVSSADNAATETVTVTEPASFDMTITNVDAAVTEGETITLAYEVTNTGDVQGTQNIDFAVNGTTEDTASGVTLNGSETVSGQFTYDTVAGDAPAVSVTVSSADDSASATVTVTEPPSFDMTITSVDSAVTEGETITVAYEVTNTGDVADTQDITFAVNGTAEDTASSVTLNGSETFNRQFTYDTVTGDAPVVSVTVSSANDTATATVTVTEPANFDVNITSVDSEVTQGETITVGYEVTNTGDVAGTQGITFAVNGTPESAESGVTLNGSETVSDQFSYDTVAGDAPAVTVTVSSEDNTASANVTVLAPAVFTVDIVETTTPVEGETLNVTADIENTGAVTSTQTVTLDVGALGTDSTAVTLGGGGSTTLTLGVGTDTGDAGGYTATVSSANATTSANVTVLTPAQFVVSNLTAPAETTVGASITVSATVTNIGETDGPQTVAFRFDGQTVVNRTVSLAPNASTTLTFTPTVPNQTGTFEHGVFTDDDNETAQITVVEPGPPNVTLSNLRIAGHGDNATVLAGSYNVSVTVSHDGGPSGVVPVELTVGPTTITENITLNASETTTVTFENATGDLSPGSYDVIVSAGNASVTGEVTLSVPVGDNPDPATDTDDDGLLEDVDGDGEFTIFDVQTLFVEFQSDPVQTNSGLFNFDGSGDGAVTIFDVQTLFLELAG